MAFKKNKFDKHIARLSKYRMSQKTNHQYQEWNRGYHYRSYSDWQGNKDIPWSIYDHEFDNLEKMDWLLKTQPIPNR